MKRIILIGYMGAGKSFLGKQLSETLHLPFIDTDSSIEKQEGVSISDLFKNKGEAYFRTLEKKLINKLESKTEFILATGGGLPCFNGLMDALNELGTTIYIRNTNETLYKRLLKEIDKRPLLKNLNEEQLLDHISKSVKKREKYYLKAQIIIDEEEQTVEKIISLLHQKS